MLLLAGSGTAAFNVLTVPGASPLCCYERGPAHTGVWQSIVNE